MQAYNKFNAFVENQWVAKIDWDSDTFKLFLTNDAVDATKAVYADLADLPTANGYVAGGANVVVTAARVGGVETISGAQVLMTASGGTVGPFRYAVLYDFTVASPAKPLVAYWDCGAPVTLADTDSIQITFNGTNPGTIHTVQ